MEKILFFLSSINYRVKNPVYTLLYAFFALIIYVFMFVNVNAQEIKILDLSNEDRQKLKLVENYLNSISTLKARFFQISPEGVNTEGTFYLRRPGKIRVEYDPPSPLLIVGDGFLLHYHDKELGQINDWPIFDTPLGALSDDSIRLNEELVVTSFKSEHGSIKLRLIQRSDPALGGITLFFSDSPIVLKQWAIDDAQGMLTRIILFEIKKNLKLDPRLFIFDDPRKQTNIR